MQFFKDSVSNHVFSFNDSIKQDTINNIITLTDSKGNIIKGLPTTLVQISETEVQNLNASNIDTNSKTLTDVQIRTKRNALILACDWTQLPKVPLTIEQVAAWDIYRQALRDITKQPTFPSNIVWPVAPV